MTNKTLVGIRMTDEQKKRLEQAAIADGRSVTQFAINAIEAYIEANQKKGELLKQIEDGLMEALASVAKAKNNTLQEDIHNV